MERRNKLFNLTEEQKRRVDRCFSEMTTEDKIGQLFCISLPVDDESTLRQVIERYKPGGFMFRPAPARDIELGSEIIRRASKVPLLLAANLECGGNGLYQEGTFFGRNLEVAATDDEQQAFRQGYVCGAEARGFHVNWAFAPVIDIDFNWRNPITNVRTYGNDPERVLRMGRAYLQGISSAHPDMAVCIKHFPGDGVDERDQHLLPTVNSLSEEDWWKSYGMVYQGLIDEGAQTLMVGHILQPALTKNRCPDIPDQYILPATLDKNLVSGLIRKELGFEGLIITDSTNMVGYTSLMSRKKALPASIMAGVDMLLFCRNMEEDFEAIREALRSGELTQERLDEAVLRQLTLKAQMNLFTEREEHPTAHPEFQDWAEECAEKAVTLVKDNQNLLPISPEKTKKVRLTVLGEQDASGAFGDSARVTEVLKNELEACGFEVSLYDYATLEHKEIVDQGVEAMQEKIDLSIVAANISTGSNYTARRINWIPMLAADCPWYVKDIPTLFISFCNPHHMLDVPFISTFINAYSANAPCVKACVRKLTGQSEFTGINPTDVWCSDVWGAKQY